MLHERHNEEAEGFCGPGVFCLPKWSREYRFTSTSIGAAASTDHQSDSELSEASDDDDYVMITSLKGQQCSFKSRLYIDYPFLEYLVQKNAVFWFPCRFFFLLRIQLKPHSP